MWCTVNAVIIGMFISSVIDGHKPTFSCNRPIFCSTASWNTLGITFANQTISGQNPLAVFVDANNWVYVVNQNTKQVLIWHNDSIDPTQVIPNSVYNSWSIFVTGTGDIYIAYNHLYRAVDKWISGTNASVVVLNTTAFCFGLFVDTNDTLYCSQTKNHTVVKRWLNDDKMTINIVAGTGVNGSAPNQLDYPQGIFVDVNFDLYVADCYNHRIQWFPLGQSTATTIAGQGSTENNITLYFPTGILLDAENYIFILEPGNGRIIRTGPNGYRCIIGCDGPGSLANQLSRPSTFSFDNYGNIFVSDQNNHRIQKFVFMTKSCDYTTTYPLTTDVQQVTPLFFTPTCPNSSNIGIDCKLPGTSCAILNPCLNDGTCDNINDVPWYSCLCPPGFNGTRCQFDHRLCKNGTCFNNGTCAGASTCICAPGWQGRRCETKINYCINVTCQNNGICRPLLLNYSCECLSSSFSGRHSILAMITVAAFVIIMDILKYCFGIDPTREELERIRREKRAKKRKPVVQRFVYVNAPSIRVSQPKEQSNRINDTRV
ncbi:unnamed protein product [Adineta ricciae]|uniref:EGF-like domain-containing protein n=1 Tax=Adineta ricciae TaxID=249248 RepID=A0A814JQA9_ADIRI|nr:unnamed protein product [Adineta ricciae]